MAKSISTRQGSARAHSRIVRRMGHQHTVAKLDLSPSSSHHCGTTIAMKDQVSVHRSRFVEWNLGFISTLALTPPTFDASVLNAGDVDGKRGLLAVGRANGNVDLMLWAGRQGWITWRTLPSPWVGSSAEGISGQAASLQYLAFAHQTRYTEWAFNLLQEQGGNPQDAMARDLSHEPYNLRLFAVGGPSSELVEWHWCGPKAGQLKAIMPTLPPIFSLAVSSGQNSLAVGCNDGSVRFVDITDGKMDLAGRVDLVETSTKKSLRVTSLAYGPPRPAKVVGDVVDPLVSPDDSYVVAGTSKSHLVKIEAPVNQDPSAERFPEKAHLFSWRPVTRLSVDKVQGQSTIVWTCLVLSDHTLVTGDSIGNVKFFDLTMGTQTHSYKSHRADVLTLTAGTSGQSIYSSGVDQKTCQFRCVGTDVSSNDSDVIPVSSNKRWVFVSGRRLHWHDVKAMVISPAYTNDHPSFADQVPILTSAGLDLSLVVIPASEPGSSGPNPVSDVVSTDFDHTLHRRMSFVPQRDQLVSVSPAKRWVSLAQGSTVSIYEIDTLANDDILDDEKSDTNPPWSKPFELDLNLQSGVTLSLLSPDGSWLVISDLFETKLFYFSSKGPSRVRAFSSILSSALPSGTIGTGSSIAVFSSDSRKIVLASCSTSTITSFDLDPELGQISDSVQAWSTEGALAQISVSQDKKFLAWVTLERRVLVANIPMGVKFELPAPPQIATALIFSPTSPLLCLTLPNNTVWIYNVAKKRLADWARPLMSSGTNASMYNCREPSRGAAFAPVPSHPLIVYGPNWLASINIEKLRSKGPPKRPQHTNGDSKRRRDDDATSRPAVPKVDPVRVNITNRYQPLVKWDFLSPTEAVSIERSWFDLARNLPDAWVRTGAFGA